MAKVITTELQHSGASAANITLDSSKNVTCENNLQVDGNVTVTGTLPADKLTGALPAISGASLTGIASSPPPFRNLVINGDMQVAQRGTSSTTSGYGTVDRFTTSYGGQDEAMTQEQVSLTSSDTGPWAKGFRKALKVTNGNQSSGAGGDDYAQTIYHFEGQDINTSGWDFADPNSKITVSFWAKSSVAQTFNLRFRAYATSGQKEYYTSFALSANTWTKVTKTIPGHADLAGIPSDNGGQLFMVFQYYYGTNLTGTQTENAWHAKDTANTYPDMTTTWWTTDDATFHLTGVQLEVADTATEFENRTYADQLLRCSRYYCSFNGQSTHWAGRVGGGSNFEGSCFTPVPMRAAPSGSISGSSATWTSYSASARGLNISTAPSVDLWFAGQCAMRLVVTSAGTHTDDRCMVIRTNNNSVFELNAEM